MPRAKSSSSGPEIEPSYTSVVGGKIGTLADATAVVAGDPTLGTTGLFSGATEYEGFAIYPGSYGQKLASYTISNAFTFLTGRASSPPSNLSPPTAVP